MANRNVLKVKTDAELMSYIINSNPELTGNIDLPVQGESLAPIGKLIMSNNRYKNAFINTINLIGLTIIDRNYWENPWEDFTNRGMINFGDSVREMICDIAEVFDYNEYANNPTHFLENVVPNVSQYIHIVNFQKFYKTTTSDEQMAMAFNTEGGLFNLIERIIGSLYEAYKYDKYIVDKYMLCRRMLDGTMSVLQIEDYANLTPRQRVAKMKDASNLMTFRSPNYNPAGLRVATSFENQITIINTQFEADLTTDVLATSYFRNEAEMRSRMALIDGFNNHDVNRLQELLGDQFIPFTEDELETLANVQGVIIDDEFYQDYKYNLDNAEEPLGADGVNGLRTTNFFNPETLKNNHWLHVWAIFSTSPFKNALIITSDKPSVTSLTINPSEASITAGGQIQLTANVNSEAFANKAVIWNIDEAPGQKEGSPVTITEEGLLKIPANYTPTTLGKDDSEPTNPIVISATSVYDQTIKNTATIVVL